MLQNSVWGSSSGAKSRRRGTCGREVTNDGSVLPRDWSQHRGQEDTRMTFSFLAGPEHGAQGDYEKVSYGQIPHPFAHTVLGPTRGLPESCAPPGRVEHLLAPPERHNKTTNQMPAASQEQCCCPFVSSRVLAGFSPFSRSFEKFCKSNRDKEHLTNPRTIFWLSGFNQFQILHTYDFIVI